MTNKPVSVIVQHNLASSKTAMGTDIEMLPVQRPASRWCMCPNALAVPIFVGKPTLCYVSLNQVVSNHYMRGIAGWPS
jgi:hypothetical protein